MRQFLYILILLVVGSACQRKETVTIRGEIKNLPERQLFLYIENNQLIELDTLSLSKKGTFKITKKLSEPSVVTLIFPDKRSWIPLYLFPSERVEIIADAPNAIDKQVKGSSVQRELEAFVRENIGLLEKENQTNNDIDRKSEKGSIRHTRFLSDLYSVKRKLAEVSENYILQHPKSLASAVILNEFFNDGNIQKAGELIDSLRGDAATFILTRRLKEQIEEIKKTEVGQKAPDFTVQTLKGDTISIGTLTKKTLLLSFTASWCDFCRTETKTLSKCLEKYQKTAPLSIVSISLDEDDQTWKAYAKEQNITWHQVTDTLGTASSLLQLYHVYEVPYSVLIDTAGVIIGRSNSCGEFTRLFTP